MSHSVPAGKDGLGPLKLALVTYGLVFVAKLAAFFYTGVIALLAESLHSMSDIVISGFLLGAALLSRREADDEHMFGHGRAQYVAALVAATLFISVTSIQLYQEAVPHLLSPSASEYRDVPVALAVIVGSMLVAFVPLLGLLKQRDRGAAAKAQMMELFNDELGLVAVLAGTLFLLAGYPIADPIAALVVATLIAINALGLVRENASLLVGRSPGNEFLNRVTNVAHEVPGVVDVHDLRAEYIGPETVRASLHIQVPRGIAIEDADEIAEEVQRRLQEATQCKYCTVHIDPTPEEEKSGERAA